MPASTLIKVVVSKKPNKPLPKEFTYQSLVGKFFNRVERMYLTIEVTSICKDEKGKQSSIYDVLTDEELAVLTQRFSHLKQKKDLPKMPEPLKKEESKDIEPDIQKVVDENFDSLIETKDSDLKIDYSTWEPDELKELLDKNSIKYDKRIKNKEKLITIIKDNNL